MRLVKLLSFFGLIAAVWFAGHSIQTVSQAAPATPPAPTVTVATPTVQEPALLAMAKDFQMDTTNLNLVYGTFPDADQLAQFEWKEDNYVDTYTITVLPGQTSNDSRQAFAHEYYHYMWHIHPDIKTRIMPSLEALYTADTPMHRRMQGYVDRGLSPNTEDFDNELFAVYCTETLTTSLPKVIHDECLSWESLSSITADRQL